MDNKFSDKMKASEVLEEVFLKCDNCGKTSKLHKVLKTIVMKHIMIYQKIITKSLTNADTKTWEKAEITLQGLYYHIKHYHNNKPHGELTMHVKSSCDNCKRVILSPH